MTIATASGKLLLLGEYSVTEGGRALVAAIARSARVEITALEAGDNLLCAPDIQPEPLAFRLTGNSLQWLTAPAKAFDLFTITVTAFLSDLRQPLPPQPFRITLCTREFFDPVSGTKMGLGSSAALTVALQRALHRHFIDPDNDLPREQQFQLGMAAHQQFQGGLGSGVDIAAGVGGSILAYQQATGNRLSIQTLAWPDRLHMALVWTGKSASTRLMLQNLAAWKQQNGSQYAQLLARMTDFSEAGIEAFAAGHSTTFLRQARCFSRAMAQLGENAGIDIFSHEHRHLAGLANDHQLVYKPSGAGGGDFGLALGLDQAAIEAFCRHCEAAGYSCPEIGINGL